jgi:hypothetical protein
LALDHTQHPVLFSGRPPGLGVTITSPSTTPPLGLGAALYYPNTNPNIISLSDSTSLLGTGFLTVTERFSAQGTTFHGFNTDAFVDEVTLVFVPEPDLRVLASTMILLGLAAQWRRQNR